MNHIDAHVRTVRRLTAMAALLAIAAASGARAAHTGQRLVAISETAMSITGDIIVAPDRITFQNGASLPFTFDRQLTGFMNEGTAVAATLYRVTAPADPVLKNANRLCGSPKQATPVTFIVMWHPEKLAGDNDPRTFAFFSTRQAPNGTSGAGMCGTYSYDLP